MYLVVLITIYFLQLPCCITYNNIRARNHYLCVIGVVPGYFHFSPISYILYQNSAFDSAKIHILLYVDYKKHYFDIILGVKSIFLIYFYCYMIFLPYLCSVKTIQRETTNKNINS